LQRNAITRKGDSFFFLAFGLRLVSLAVLWKNEILTLGNKNPEERATSFIIIYTINNL